MPAAVNFLAPAGIGLSCPTRSERLWRGFARPGRGPYWPSYTTDLDLIRRINTGSVKDVAKIGPGIGGDPPGELITAAIRTAVSRASCRARCCGGRRSRPRWCHCRRSGGQRTAIARLPQIMRRPLAPSWWR